MEEIKLSDNVIDQIKDFDNWDLTEEQKSLIDKLILNKELKKYYKKYGLCNECKQPKNNDSWCRLCTFQQNFKNWTSGNHEIDEFIQKAQLKAKNSWEVLEWIEYDRFEDVEYLANGGFGTTYKATWKDGCMINWDSENNQWGRYIKNEKGLTVALKCLHNSHNITVEFLREIKSHLIMGDSQDIVRCYGITKKSETDNFMMVMEYMNNGNLRQHLNNNFNSLDWTRKLQNLHRIAFGLKSIHENKLIHRDFHCGNILCDDNFSYITDLGLCRPANVKPSQSGNKKIYGVLPYVAPEVLKGKEHTQASDIYGFGIIAYELCTGSPPYHDAAHDEFLAVKICQGLRPTSSYKIPQLILDLIKQCWDADPLKRPNAEELEGFLENLCSGSSNSLIIDQIKEADEVIEKLPSPSSSISYTLHSQAIYTSRLLVFNDDLPEPKNADNNDNSIEKVYSGSTRIDFTKHNTNSKDGSMEATK